MSVHDQRKDASRQGDNRSNENIEWITAEQPAYVQIMIEELGPDALMKDALKTAPCFFCKSKGDLLISLGSYD